MEKSNWKRLEELGNLEGLASGGDSYVSKLTTEKSKVVTKEYDYLVNSLGNSLSKEILIGYYADTERAQEILEKEPNPLNQSIQIDNKDYSINYIVVPQGGLLFESDRNVNYESSKVKSHISVSQKYISGLNMSNLAIGNFTKEVVSANQSSLYQNYKSLREIRILVVELFSYLNDNPKVEFTTADMNFKPFLDKENSTLQVYITDLAGSLVEYFLKSSSMKSVREKYPQIPRQLGD